MDPGIPVQVGRAREPPGEDDHVEIVIHNLVQRLIGHHTRAVAGLDDASLKPGGDDLDTGTAQEVDQGDGLKLLEARGQGDQYAGHGHSSLPRVAGAPRGLPGWHGGPSKGSGPAGH